MQIKLVYDASVNKAPSGFTTALNAAVTYLDNLITNPITVNIEVGWQEDQGQPFTGDDIGEGDPTNGIDLTYAQLRSDLAANATSSADATAIAHLPSSDPTNGGEFNVSSAEETALGFLAANSGGLDGAVGFGGSATFDFNPNDRAVPNEIDFVGVAEHELTHAMGRISGLQQDGSNEYTTLDLFRFAAPSVRQLGLGLPAYFSIDDGKTDLDNYDTVSDPADWASTNSGDSFDSVSYAGIANVVTQADITEMDVIGFTIAGTADPLTITGTAADQALIDQSTIAPLSRVQISDANSNQTETVTVTLSSAANGVLMNLGGGTTTRVPACIQLMGRWQRSPRRSMGWSSRPHSIRLPRAGPSPPTSHCRSATPPAPPPPIQLPAWWPCRLVPPAAIPTLSRCRCHPAAVFTNSGTALFGGTQVTWSGTATVTDVPSSLQWTAYSGTMAQEILAAQSPIASDVPSIQFTNSTLTALGLPFDAAGLALWGDPTGSTSGASASDAIAYTFSAPAPAGTPFLLWAPGGSDNRNNGPDTFTLSAWLGGAAISTVGWTFSVLNPFGATPAATYHRPGNRSGHRQ